MDDNFFMNATIYNTGDRSFQTDGAALPKILSDEIRTVEINSKYELSAAVEGICLGRWCMAGSDFPGYPLCHPEPIFDYLWVVGTQVTCPVKKYIYIIYILFFLFEVFF